MKNIFSLDLIIASLSAALIYSVSSKCSAESHGIAVQVLTATRIGEETQPTGLDDVLKCYDRTLARFERSGFKTLQVDKDSAGHYRDEDFEKATGWPVTEHGRLAFIYGDTRGFLLRGPENASYFVSAPSPAKGENVSRLIVNLPNEKRMFVTTFDVGGQVQTGVVPGYGVNKELFEKAAVYKPKKISNFDAKATQGLSKALDERLGSNLEVFLKGYILRAEKKELTEPDRQIFLSIGSPKEALASMEFCSSILQQQNQNTSALIKRLQTLNESWQRAYDWASEQK